MMEELDLNKYLCTTASGSKWERAGIRRRSGVLVPLFSVYSKQSVGIGDLADLKLLIDWCAKTGNSIIQLLPMNEMGSMLCPYDAISSFALEPSYICLDAIVPFQDRRTKIKIENLKLMFPAGRPHVNYNIKKEKLFILWEVYIQEMNNRVEEFRKYREENAYWVDDLALFKIIKGYHKGAAWYEWEDGFKNRDKLTLDTFIREHEREINFELWIQWHLYRQLKEAKEYAATKKVLIKGDLPILVSIDSADVWAHPGFFKLEYASGAPVDMYCAKGQRWGMPPNNWEAIALDGYRYIKEKLRYAENFYDIIRVDHVVGLFRIWSIPYDDPLENQGLNGFFDPPEKDKWGEHGLKILSQMLGSTNMLLCAEDLGTIPQVCTDALKKLGIPGNDVQRWVKDWKIKHDFLKPEEYRALSVAMLSTHDTTNWPAWWENEAGTIDEALFERKCNDRKIDYILVKNKLFDFVLSGHGRLRWLKSIDSVDKLVSILGKRKEEVMDFIGMYEDTFQEKEKLWIHLGLGGSMREKCDPEIVAAALKFTLESEAVFCIQTIIDWLYLTDVFQGDSYQYRLNTPGTTSPNNWSLVMPISLGNLLKDEVCQDIRNMVVASGRI